MSYNKRIWANGDLITKERMNNIENGIYDAHDKINTINNKVEENTTDTNTVRQDISDIKLQIGTEELTTTSKKIKGAINDLSSQIKDITNSGVSGIMFENIEVGEIFTSVEEVIECTGITLSTNTLSFTTTNTQTLSVVMSPTGCTEIVTWSVEPVGVVTVNNGVVTPVANGTATITVTCGSQSATCNVTVSGIVKRYSITNNLSNVINNNDVNTVEENTSYTAILTANENYAISTVTVTMGGVDITDTAYVDGVITINTITGNIVITARANSTIVSPAIRAKIETIDTQDYLVIEDWGNVREIDGTSVLAANSYSNDNYQIYKCEPSFAEIWDKENTTPFIPMINSIVKSTVGSNGSFLNDTQEGDLYLYLSPFIYLRLPKDITPYDSIDSYMKDKYNGMKFALATCNTKEIDPTKITSITIKENSENCQYAQFRYSDLPTGNIYNGANSLTVNTYSNANLGGASAPAAAMSTSVLSMKFLPGTFTDFTLDAVKEYLTVNKLIFWYV